MRRRYIDCMRGVAVLIMIEAHVVDAWTRLADRGSVGYRDLTILGGFAAPLFLSLAGVALALSAGRVAATDVSRRAQGATIVRRGAEIFILAFLFRLQAFVVTPGSHLVTLFRVDILNVMGPAIAAAGLVHMISATRVAFAVMSGVLATAIAMLTPTLRIASWVDVLPIWLQWYLRPAGEHTTFTLFPWSGFVFAGAAIGAVLVGSRERRSERLLLASIAAAGLALVVVGFYTASLPTMYRSASFWESSPTYFAIRVGVIAVSVGIASAVLPLAHWVPGPFVVVERFGRQSLFIYWIHVELVYGYLTWAIHRRLPVWGTVVAYVLFAALMYGTISLRAFLVGLWRARGHQALAQRPSLG